MRLCYAITEGRRDEPTRRPGRVLSGGGAGVWLLGLGAFACTLAGGALALGLRRGLRLVTGVSAGAVIGLALFELIPEAARLPGAFSLEAVMLSVGVGFCLYMAAQRALERLGAGGRLIHLAPASLAMHSLFDGLGIGLAFKVSPQVGLAVAVAVLAHDLCDGVNTVGVVLRGEGAPARRLAWGWLVANAAAPLAGIAAARLSPLGAGVFAPLAAGFAGVFLYIGAAELLPRSLSGWRSPWASLAPIAGVACIYLVSSLTR